MRPPRNVPDREHNRRCFERDSGYGHDAAYRLAVDQQVAGLLLEQREVRLVLQDGSDRLPVELAVGLRARGPYCRTLAGIEGAELDAGSIRGARHDAAQRIDLADQVALADAADGRIAAHLTERLDALRQQ